MASGNRRKPSTTGSNRTRVWAGILALCLGSTVVSAGAAHAAGSQTSNSLATSSNPRYAALAKAASTDQPVTIDSLTTADSTTQALPNGTLATTTTLEPTRMQNASGAWESIDPTLVQNADGTISTTATPNGLTLSGGGTGPAITATDQSGHSLALSLPVSLPSPTLSEASATYQNVYPGVNLTVTAAPTGGFSEVFTVTDPAAQAQADSLKFTTQLNGLTMSQTSDDSLSVVDSTTGQTVMSAPPAIMWDSATTGDPANGVSDEFEDATNADSSTAGPGLGAHTGTLPVTDTSSTLTLSANPSSLDTTSPTYPVYDDPTWTEPYQSGGTQAYDEFEEGSGCEGYNNFDNVSQPGVGVVTTNTACPGPYESYFQIDTSNVLNSSYDIKSATLKIDEEYSSLDSCGEGSETISIYTTSPISGATESNYWTSRPAHGQLIDTEALESDGNGDGTMCSGNVVAGNFNVLSGIQQVRANNWANWTFAMVETGTIGSNSLERFNNNPSIYTVYDIPPNTPGDLNTWPTPVTGITSTGKLGTNSCPGQSDPGYLGIGNIGGNDVAILSAQLTSPIAAAQMQGDFTLKNMTTGSSTPYTSSGYANSGANVSVQTSSMTNGDEYNWSVQANDQYDSSPSSTACYFKADTTPPTNPKVTASTWPTLSSGTPGTVYAGTAGSFTVSASDAISGIAGYYYSIDAYPVPSSGGTFQTGATIDYTPLAWGAHTLYVQSLDNAGNVSAVTSYSVYVPWSPASDGVTGAVSGGPVPDLLTTPTTGTDAGDLVMVPGESTPDITPTVVSNPSYSPDGTAWSNFQVTHNGSYTNHLGFDDLWAFQNNTDSLYLYLNNSSSTPFETGTLNPIGKFQVDDDAFNNPYFKDHTFTDACVPTAASNCSTYDDTNWNEVTQILAPGDLYAGDPNTVNTTTGETNGAVDNGAPGLLTVENGALWYYQGQNGSNYLNIVEQLGTTGWNNATLIGTDTTGSGSSTKTYLLARINAPGQSTDGQIMQYPISFDSAGNLNNLQTPTSGSGTALTLPDSGNNPKDTDNDLPAAAYPLLYALNMHNTGDSDLIATTPSGAIIDWPGTTPETASTGTVAQFANPESLAAATSTSTTITLPSVGTDYPSGTTWDDGTATLAFNDGQLTVTQDATRQVLAQYGAPTTGSYFTVQTDGNIVIYAASGAVIWAADQGASGDSLNLSGSTLTLTSAAGSTDWKAESSVPLSPGTTGETAFTTSNNTVAIAIGAGAVYTQDPIATGTSPSIADLGSNAYIVAFQGANGDLETYSSANGLTDTGNPMAAATSPAIAAYSGGGWAAAFQAPNGAMETLTSTGTLVNSEQGMDTGTSPAIAASPSGGYEVAFQINTNDLHTDAYTSLTAATGTITDHSLGMAAGTNPAIAALSTGGYEIAFQANTGSLWLNGPGSGGGDESLGMATGTSPSLTALANGEWQAAFEDSSDVLWTHGNVPGTTNTGITMAAGTSPSITGLGGENFAMAWQSTSSTLTSMIYDGSQANTGHTMNAKTSPSLTS